MKKIIITTLFILGLLTSSTSAQFTVILNFDDGYQGVYNNAFPVMEKNNIPGVIFIPTNYINKKGHLSLEELSFLKKAGWEIGSHTVHHPDLTSLTVEGIKKELVNSKQFLQEKNFINSNYASFCSPMSAWNKQIENIAAEHYQIARGKELFDFIRGIKPAVLIKVVVKKTRLLTVNEWIQKAQEKGIPLILVFHEIDYGGNEYFYPPDKFIKIIEMIKDYKINTYASFYGTKK